MDSLDLPAVKRQRTINGYQSTSASAPASNTNAYNSDNDDGDEILKDFVPDTPGKAFETQPTQILGDNGGRIIPTAQPTFSTPPPPSSVIQVPASSPIHTQSPRPTPRPVSGAGIAGKGMKNMPQLQTFPINKPPGKNDFARSFAPPGTVFRAPPGSGLFPTAKPKAITIEDDEGPKFQGGSSDSEIDERANIKSSTFVARSGGSFGSSISPSTSMNGNAKFQSIVANSGYTPNGTTGAVRQTAGGPLRKPGMQSRPERPNAIIMEGVSSKEDPKLKAAIQRLRIIFGEKIGYAALRNALLAKKGNVEDAAEFIGNALNKNNPNKAQAATVLKPSPLVISDGESSDLEEIVKPVGPQMKRGLNAPIVSIKDRYSSTQQAPRSPAIATPPPKPKRKLMQGRRNPVASSPAVPSPLKPQLSSPAAPPSPVISLLDDDTDSGIESAPEEDVELGGRVLKYLNTCEKNDLIELVNCTPANAALMVAARPFKNLDAARNVANNTALKSGKKSARAAIGDKIVDNAVNMFSGYEAIDALVSRCEDIGKPLVAEMATWGFDVFGAAKGGELEMTSFEEDDAASQRDSGIGSPSSGAVSVNGDVGDDDIKINSVKKRRGKVSFLSKPSMMAEDCVLKDYQVVGLNWLALMYSHNLSGILADEMGLGKTCQVISFLSHLIEQGHPGPHLVICPGSTLENWLREFRNFSPGIVAAPYYGSAKERRDMAEDLLERRESINVIVTTYDLAAKPEDNKFMRRLKPDVAVYDEGHYLKNPNSQRYQGLIKIPSKFRLLLTGTPLQNNLQELAALLGFILPEVFKERKDDLDFIFKAKASTRDADHAALLSAQRIARARSMLTPFVLRRKKAQVLKHLPAKTCRVEYCEMLPAQQQIYDGHIDSARERAKARIEGTKIPKSDENNPLMQLRKASIHPMLFRRHFTDAKIEKMADILRKKAPEYFDPEKKREHLVNEMKNGSDFWLHNWCLDYPCIKSFDVPDLAWLDSGKVEAMMKLVKQYKENGDRVLIFSQFALVLDILEAVLNTNLVHFTRIDGSTKIDERQTLIDTYRDDESITVFLLTTKAGGTGINLMYANKVIIFDGSFNPQDDRQAENRAHRVGQTRPVEVVRLVTKDTIEEAIYALGVSKLVLDGRVAGDDEGISEEAGEKAISKMLFEGGGWGKAKELTEKAEDAEAKAPAASQGGTGRKKESILDMLTKKPTVETDGDGEEMLV